MENLLYKIENKELNILFKNRIGSINSEEIEKEAFEIVESNIFDKLILDLSDLEYSSSAGLRIFLKLGKKYNNFEIIEVNSNMYEIFETTGFTDIFKIKKAYKKVSVDGLEIIGKGANGVVYRINEDTIIKVYKENAKIEDIKKERELAKKAFILGIPTAISYEIVKVGNCFGSIFELIKSYSLAELIKSEPNKFDYYINKYVELIKKVHSIFIDEDEFVSIKKRYIKYLNDVKPILSDIEYEKLDLIIKSIPDDKNIIHGDLHIKNVMFQGDETILIDMDTLAYGNYVFEIANLFNTYEGFGLLDENKITNFLGLDKELINKIWESTLSLYFVDRLEEKEEAIKKAKILGYLKLFRHYYIYKEKYSEDEVINYLNAYKNAIVGCLKI